MKRNIFLPVIFLLLIITAFIACRKHDDSPAIANTDVSSRNEVITSLSDMKGDTATWYKDGKYIQVVHVTDNDIESETESDRIITPENTTACSDNFSGSARAYAKTTYSTATTVTYTTIPTLRSTLQSDTYMHTLGITNSSQRVTEEKRNVSITTLYLYAIKREDDNDYHLIIGNSADSTQLLNCESSGLPSRSYSSYNTIKSVRSYLKSYFGTDFCGVTSYTRFTPPLPITVLKGSLFYDIDHAPGTIGPLGLRPNTSWEIHPLNSIHF